MRVIKTVTFCMAGLAIILGPPVHGQAQTTASSRQAARPQNASRPAPEKVHQVVVQVTQNDPALMNMALNNAENLIKHYQSKGEKVEVEFVTYGPGLNMLRDDTSPVKDRIAAISGSQKNITFSGCGNTLANQSKMENKEISLVPQARIVPTGIARIVELEEQGWTYVRP